MPIAEAGSDSDHKRKSPATFLAYRVGIVPSWKNKWSRVKISKNTPLRVEWSERPLADNLTTVIRRRLMVEADTQRQPPFDMQLTLPLADVFAFLNNETDDHAIARWLDRFLLFDWSFLQSAEREALSRFLHSAESGSAASIYAAAAVFCFFRPLFHNYTFTQIDPERKSGKTPTAGMLRPLVALLERGDTASAFSAAQSRYRNLLIKTANFGEANFASLNTCRLLAALLLPASPSGVAKYFSRWQLPARNKQ